jgi:hypothetical protein
MSQQYLSAHTLSVATVALLAANVVTDLLEIVLNLVFLGLYPDLSLPDEPSGGDMAFGLSALGLVAVSVVIYLSTIVVVLMWLYRSCRNLLAFNVQGLEATPGWAVGYWFVPILSLFKPLKIVNELYHSSLAEDRDEMFTFTNNSSTALTGGWWATWIATLLLSNVANALERGAGNNATRASVVVQIAALAFSVMAAVLLIMIVREIDARQTATASELAAAAAEPPPPPIFHNDTTDQQ